MRCGSDYEATSHADPRRGPHMNTWLLTWNPRYHGTGSTLPHEAKRVQAGRITKSDWSCGVNKSIRLGDRLFLLRLGKEPKGIVGAGFATGIPYKGRPWTGKPSRKPALYVDFRWDGLLDSDPDSADQAPLPLQRLRQGSLRRINWITQASGISIPPDLAPELERLWAKHYAEVTGRSPGVSPVPIPTDANDDLDSEAQAFEGQRKRLFVIHRHREYSLRNQKIIMAQNAGRLRCEVPGCGFDFARVYGALGAGFAEVHHLKPLSHLRRGQITTLNDLAIVCANCHRMIHRHGQCRRLDSLVPRQFA